MYEDDMPLADADLESGDWYDVMEDHDALAWDAMVLESVGWGTDEDYGYYEQDEWDF